MFEAEHLATLRVDPGHHMLDRAIFSGRIHPLKDKQYRMALGCLKELLTSHILHGSASTNDRTLAIFGNGQWAAAACTRHTLHCCA
jgi:hypothetical protein